MADKVDLTGFSDIPETVHAEHFKTIYTNTVKMGISPWDIRVTLGQVLERVPGTIINEEQTTIVMSPQHAKLVSKSLAETVESYENTFGKIPEIKAVIDNARAGGNSPVEEPAKNKD